MTTTSTTTTATQFLEEIKDALVKAFMNAPQIDGRTHARVPLDLAVASPATRARLMEEQKSQSGVYWASVPQLPIASSSA